MSLCLPLTKANCQNYNKLSVKELAKVVTNDESKIKDVKKNNSASISWGQEPYQKTDLSFVYLHGFGASKMEAQPVIEHLASQYNANVYYARLKGHGRTSVEGFKNLTKENYLKSAENAYKIGKRIGDEVILISTSTGGTLSLSLAKKYKDIAGLIMYSPFVGLKNPMMAQITTKKGKAQFKKMIGGEVRHMDRPDNEAKYWSTNYHINAYVALIKLVQTEMNKATFQSVKLPVFLGYYYKNEQEQDQVVSVQAMKDMFKQLSTPDKLKTKRAFPQTGNHVIASSIRSDNWKAVEKATSVFINNKILKP
jgi:esterase/lipase